MRRKRSAVAHTVEDAEGLLNSLLLLTVLMLAFAVNQTTAIFSLEDFLLADQRDATAWWNNQGRQEFTGSPYGRGFVSHYFLIMGMWSILLLVAALVLGVISYISLCYSDARESPREQIPDDVVEGAPLDHGSCMACLPCRHVLLPSCDARRAGYYITEVHVFHDRERDGQRTRLAGPYLWNYTARREIT